MGVSLKFTLATMQLVVRFYVLEVGKIVIGVLMLFTMIFIFVNTGDIPICSLGMALDCLWPNWGESLRLLI